MGRRAYVLDPKARAVTLLEVSSGKVLAKTALAGQEPQEMMITREGSRLIVLHALAGKQSIRFGFHPSSQTEVTLMDARSLQVVGRVPVGWGWYDFGGYKAAGLMLTSSDWGLADVVVAPDGKRAVIVCPGYESNNPAETLPRELVVLDLISGRVSARVDLGTPSPPYPQEGPTSPELNARLGRPLEAQPLVSWNQDRAIAYSAPKVQKDRIVSKAQLRFVELTTGISTLTVSLEWVPQALALAPDGALLYVLVHDEPSRGPFAQPTSPGRLLILATATGELQAKFELGIAPRNLVLDPTFGRMLVLSAANVTPSGETVAGQLHAVRGTELIASVPVAAWPSFLRLSSDQETLAVVGATGLTLVGFADLKPRAVVQLDPQAVHRVRHYTGGWTKELKGKCPVSELLFSPDNRHALALYELAGRVSSLDLQTSKATAPVAIMLRSNNQLDLDEEAGIILDGNPRYGQGEGGLEPTRTAVVFRPDGRYAYVPDAAKGEISILDCLSGEIVKHLDAPHGEEAPFQMVPGTSSLLVASWRGVTFIDTTSNTIATSWKPARSWKGMSGASGFSLSPDGRYLVLFEGHEVVCMDAFTGAVLAQLKDFQEPHQVIFEPAAPP
jgi:DNA-binding beta-propeller fold protein YncE